MDVEEVMPSNILVKISSEKNGVRITVTGDISAQIARNETKKQNVSMHTDALIVPNIISVPYGYQIDICDRKNIKSFLVENGYINCFQIFTICNTIKKLFDSCGKEVFSDILFDYNAVFVSEGITSLSFIYVPFLHLDGKRIRFKEFLRILFVHMEEQDAYSEQFVMRLIESVTNWENSNYDKNLSGAVTLCIESFMDNYRKDTKRDFLSKSFETIRQFVSNRSLTEKVINSDRIVILFLCAETKKRYSFVFDKIQNVFYISTGQAKDDVKQTPFLKIGRDKKWADMHIADIMVSGHFGIVKFDGNCFCVEIVAPSAKDVSKNCSTANMCKLENGSQFCIGKKIYNVVIRAKSE